jgi:hypothetical protein
MTFIPEELIARAPEDPTVMRQLLTSIIDEVNRLDSSVRVAKEIVATYMPAFPAGETMQPEIGVSIRGGALFKALPADGDPAPFSGVTVYQEMSGMWRVAMGGAVWWRKSERTLTPPGAEMFLSTAGGLITSAGVAGTKMRVGRSVRSEPGRDLVVIDPLAFFGI